MVDVAAIFDEIFGPDEQAKGSCQKRCVRCVGVSEADKPIETNKYPDTPGAAEKHTSNRGVSEPGERCVHDIVEYQGVAGQDTPTHQTHLKRKTPETPADPDAFEERAALMHEGHIRIWDFRARGKLVPEPVHEMPLREAETLAAQEQGHPDADSLHGATVARWAAAIDRMARRRAVTPEGSQALTRARAFIAEGWALQAARLGWDEIQLFGVCPHAAWRHPDRKGVAFGGAVLAVTADAITHVGGLRRYRATINNDGGAVPIWTLSGGSAA